MNLILGGNSDLVGYFDNNGHIVSLIVVTKSEYSNVLFFAGSGSTLKKLFQNYSKEASTLCFVLQTNDSTLANTIEKLVLENMVY